MKKNVILSTLLIATGFLLAQPGKPKGPGGQYSERMEMMMVWKLTDHLELSQSQAEKFFPVMRAHQKQLMEILTKITLDSWTCIQMVINHVSE